MPVLSTRWRHFKNARWLEVIIRLHKRYEADDRDAGSIAERVIGFVVLLLWPSKPVQQGQNV